MKLAKANKNKEKWVAVRQLVDRGYPVKNAIKKVGMLEGNYAYWNGKMNAEQKAKGKIVRPKKTVSKVKRFSLAPSFGGGPEEKVTIAGSPKALATFFSSIKQGQSE